jgi:hypothetical protein
LGEDGGHDLRPVAVQVDPIDRVAQPTLGSYAIDGFGIAQSDRLPHRAEPSLLDEG